MQCTYPSIAAVAVYILLEALDAFVQVVVVVRADVDEDAAAEHLAQVFGVGPVGCDVVGEVEGLPVLDGFWVDLAGDFVPGLELRVSLLWSTGRSQSILPRAGSRSVLGLQRRCSRRCIGQ